MDDWFEESDDFDEFSPEDESVDEIIERSSIDDDFLRNDNRKKSDKNFESFDEIQGDVLNNYMKEEGRRQNHIKSVRWHLNNVGDTIPPITEETLALRQEYAEDFPRLHREIFTQSSGLKPLGSVQIDSSNHSYRIIKNGGRLLKLEPRGFGKTTRLANEILFSILMGYRKYALIICASARKALDIVEAIHGELVGNEKLAKLFPQECHCFAAADENPQRAKFQHLSGEKTYIVMQRDKLVFPSLEGSLSSGSVIQVKPKNNVRGTILRVKEGPRKGKVLRPDLIGMDDLQTDQDAINSKTSEKIVKMVKQSILRSGGHSTNLAAIFAATPIHEGDVPHHFYFNERSWETVTYKMLESMPKNMDWWLNDYKRVLLSFDRSSPGSKIEARLKACEFYKENFDYANEGAKASWDWAFEWDTDPPMEVSAIQHAMNILIEEGVEVFDHECQTKLQDHDETTGFTRCSKEVIVSKQTNRPRNVVAQGARKIVTHIDAQGEFLSFVTMASPDHFEPEIINYGIWPHTNRLRWEKKHVKGLSSKYEGSVGLRIYQAVSDFTSILAQQKFQREDGVVLFHDLILIDRGWQTEEVDRAIRDSPHASILKGHYGLFVSAKDKPVNQKNYNTACRVHHYCVTIPAPRSRQEALHTDVNHYKTKVHEGFALRQGLPGSICLFQEEYPHQHSIVADHLWAEKPIEDYWEKEKRTTYIWKAVHDDNELFDNIVGCCAGFAMLGVQMQKSARDKKSSKKFDMADYFDSMR